MLLSGGSPNYSREALTRSLADSLQGPQVAFPLRALRLPQTVQIPSARSRSRHARVLSAPVCAVEPGGRLSGAGEIRGVRGVSKSVCAWPGSIRAILVRLQGLQSS